MKISMPFVAAFEGCKLRACCYGVDAPGLVGHVRSDMPTRHVHDVPRDISV